MITLTLYAYTFFKLTILEPKPRQSVSNMHRFEQAQAQVPVDSREQSLVTLFRRYKSPLEPYAKNFIEEADKNKIDWKILPAISVIESTAGKHVPKHSPYNAWGWGCSTAKACIVFDNYPDAIQTVAFALGNKRAYKEFQRTGSIEVLSKRYCGGDSKAWARKVRGVMDQLK